MATSSPSPEAGTAPLYVNYGGEQVFQQPYAARGMRLYGFLLPIPGGNHDLPQQFVNRVFNTPSGGAVDFQVALPLVMLSFQHFADLGSLGPPDSLKGGFAYNEATFWLPVTNKKQPGLLPSYFVPYIFADNHYAIAAGREVYGYAKALGQITMPQAPGDALNFNLTTEVIEKFSPTALGQWATLVEITHDTPKPQPEPLWEKLEHAAEHIAEQVVDKVVGDAIEFVVSDLFQPKVEMVFLKQFRDVADGANACYQSIVKGAGAITDFQGGAPLGDDFQVTINSYDSHPISADLGLEASSTAFGFYMDFSFNILNGEEIWKAS